MKILNIVFLIATLVLISCNNNDIQDELKCETSQDCAGATCCHAKTCVNINHRPNCQGMACTMMCEPGTMDCGQGECVCENNQCTAKIE